MIHIKECGINWTNGEEQSGAERMRRRRHIFNHEFSGHIAIKMPWGAESLKIPTLSLAIFLAPHSAEFVSRMYSNQNCATLP